MKKLLGLDNRAIVGAAIGLAIGTIFFVAYKQHCAAEKYKAHREQYCAALMVSAEQKKACAEEGAGARDYLPWGYNLVAWPDGITTWAIIFTGFVIAWQAWETRDSIRLQEAAMEQWVKIVNWSVLVRDLSAPIGGVVQVKFEIVNGSQFPLTMLNAQLVFSGHTIYSTGDNVFMAPDTPYIASVQLPLTTPEIAQYKSSILTMRITGYMSHVGRLKKNPITQGFTGFLVFGEGVDTYFREEISMIPKETDQNGAGKAK